MLCSFVFTAPWVVLYTDYDNTMIRYECGDVDGFGQCVPDERQVFVMKRSTDLEADWHDRYDQVFRDACIEPISVKEKNIDGKDKLKLQIWKCTQT